MEHQDDLSEAMEVFLKQLPDPSLSSTSTITSEIMIGGRKTMLIAQKVKGVTGLTWKIYPAETHLLERIRY